MEAPWFDASWIGRRLDDATLVAMEAVAATERGDGVPALDLGGERGEYHTMVLDGPLYAHRVPLVTGPAVELEMGARAAEYDGGNAELGMRGSTVGLVDATLDQSER